MDILERLKMPKDYGKDNSTIDEFNRDMKVKQIKELEDYIKKEKQSLVEHEQKNYNSSDKHYATAINVLLIMAFVNLLLTASCIAFVLYK
jgi:F0F1-type ATP synthase assembly protein I